MRRRLRALGNGVGRALSGVRKNPATAIAVVTIVAVAFFLVGSLYTAGGAFDAVTRSLQRTHMVLYLEHGVAAERAGDIRAAMAQLDGVVEAEYVAPERALALVRETLDPDDPVLAGMEAGMLPASIEVTLDAGMRDVAALAPAVERLRAMDGVEDVDFAGHRVDDLSGLRAGVRGAGIIAVFALLVLALYLATSALAAGVGARANEAAVARLFGASPAYVHGPLVLEGALLGVLGAGLALIGLWSFLACVAPGASALFGASAGHALAMPRTGVSLSFVGAGALLGACSAWLAGGRVAGRRRADA